MGVRLVWNPYAVCSVRARTKAGDRAGWRKEVKTNRRKMKKNLSVRTVII